MTFDEIHPSVRNSYAAHQRLLRLGFVADDLFTGALHGIVRVAIQRGGKNLFVIDVCLTKLSYEAYATKWNAFAHACASSPSTISHETRERMYDEWKCSAVSLIVALQAKGLLPELAPKHD